MASLWDGLIEHGRPISALAARLLLRQRLGITSERDELRLEAEIGSRLPTAWAREEFGGMTVIARALRSRVLNVSDTPATVLLLALLDEDTDKLLTSLCRSQSSAEKSTVVKI